MTARADFQTLLIRNRRRVDAERREFAQRVLEAVRSAQDAQDAPFGMMAYARTRNALGPILDEFYGRYPGDRQARFWRLILDECRAARGLAFQRSVQDVRKRLKGEPELMRAIREG